MPSEKMFDWTYIAHVVFHRQLILNSLKCDQCLPSSTLQPPEKQVKEATDYCFEMLEKMDKARLNGDYHEVSYQHQIKTD